MIFLCSDKHATVRLPPARLKQAYEMRSICLQNRKSFGLAPGAETSYKAGFEYSSKSITQSCWQSSKLRLSWMPCAWHIWHLVGFFFALISVVICHLTSWGDGWRHYFWFEQVFHYRYLWSSCYARYEFQSSCLPRRTYYQVCKVCFVESDSSLVLCIFPTPVTRDNPLQQSCDRYLKTHLNEAGSSLVSWCSSCDSIADLDVWLLDQYLTFFVVVRFHRMPTDENELQKRNSHGERGDTAVTGWTRRWNHWGSCGALECRCVCGGMASLLVQCRKEVY